LPAVGQLTGAEPIAGGGEEHEFFRELREGRDDAHEMTEELPSPPPPPPSPAPPEPTAYLPEARGVYHFAGGNVPASNVFQFPGARLDAPVPLAVPPASVWHHHEQAHRTGVEPSRGRARSSRCPRPAGARNHYRAGHFIAALFALMGWLMVGAGAAASAISILQPEVPTRLGSPDLLVPAAVVLISGLFTVGLGLAARALFDLANSSRELVAIQRELLDQE
jgi:hypothetical protein